MSSCIRAVKGSVFLWDPSTNEWVRGLVEPLASVFAALTHLGDGALLLVLGVLIYWFGALESRRDRVFVIAVGVAALALSAGLKGVVQLPRPELAFAPEGILGIRSRVPTRWAVRRFTGAAVTVEWSTRLRRYLLAGSVIVIVAFSRVVMGVHYLGDVVVGVALGSRWLPSASGHATKGCSSLARCLHSRSSSLLSRHCLVPVSF
ncbi:phosphatase PAP2 family protein [Natrialba swarupiae]|nr:phosphatase PAP2 family protein [Natrialba swarupiae]